MTQQPNPSPTAITAFSERDILPDIRLPNAMGKLQILSNSMTGKRLAIVICADPRLPVCEALLRGLRDCFEALDPLVHLFVVTLTAPEVNAEVVACENYPFGFLSDLERQVSQGLNVTHNLQYDPQIPDAGAATVILADANRRVEVLDRDITAADYAETLLAGLRTQPNRTAQQVGAVAPVLYLPRVFEPAFCQDLITAWETQGNQRSGVMISQGKVGESAHAFDPTIKERRDHFVSDPALIEGIRLRFARRVVPEIHKAFTRQVVGYEEFKVVCYEAEQKGHFSAHRDNVHDHHAHRRFAMTLNLNAGAYEGGFLRFPEYGPDLYRPATGDAVVFSCSLLHEALPVTSGRRFVLLAFMFDDESRKQNDRFAAP